MQQAKELMVGLEVHVYVNLENKQKLFCPCKIDPNAEPNTTICPRCTAQPGSKPMLPNAEAVTKVIKTSLMLNCKVNRELLWQRKHYDWPDLPKGYQITMSGSYGAPAAENGNFLGIRIKECHLEEDPARWDPVTGEIDYNRSGYPLIEIVTEPDFESSEQVKNWLKNLITTLSYVKAVNKDLGVKCDVNVSIAPDFKRVEVKNVNSFSSIIKAIEHELQRQKTEKVHEQHTRQWSDADQVTKFMRSKEQALDYMFIPDPDLPVVEVTEKMFKDIQKELPEKPEQKLQKLIKAGVEKTTAEVIATDLPLSELFEKLSKQVPPSSAANWLRKELMRVMNDNDKSFPELNISEQHIIELVTLFESSKITDKVARNILHELSQKPFSPKEYVEKQDLGAISNADELEKLCKEAMQAHPSVVQDYKSGKSEAINFLVGQVMKATKGKAKPQELKDLFVKLIK